MIKTNRTSRTFSERNARLTSFVDQQKKNQEKTKPNPKFKTRVLQKNLVYCIGLPVEIAKMEVLQKREYLGQYGIIDKISINENGFTNKDTKGPSYSVYVTFKDQIQAAIAILGLNNLVFQHQLIRASFGTTKYCNYFLKKLPCFNLPNCYFLHHFEPHNEVDQKDNKPYKELFDNQQKIAEKIVLENYKKIHLSEDPFEAIFPTIKEILEEFEIYIELQPNPEHIEQQKPVDPSRLKSQPKNQILQQQQPQFFETRLTKAHSDIIPSRHNFEEVSLDEFIRRMILGSCLKSYDLKSKFEFAFCKEGHDEQQIKRIKKYMVQHLKKM